MLVFFCTFFMFRFLRMRHTSSLRARLRLTFDSIAETCRLTTMSAPRNFAAAATAGAVASCELRTCAMQRVLANLALSLLSLFVHAATAIGHKYILINNL